MNPQQPTCKDPASLVASPRDRLIEGADLESIIQQISLFYELGEVLYYREIGVGYEDCNIIIQTKVNRYVAKLFASSRSAEDISRYVDIMSHVSAAAVRHPELIVGKSGNFALHHDGVWATLAYFIEGKTFYELGRTPSTPERREILAQVASINKIDHRPAYIPNSWNTARYEEMLVKVGSQLSPAEIGALAETYRRFNVAPTNSLTHSLIHGDLRSTNILLDSTGKIYILDYFLANYRPRLQELATLAATLFYNPETHKTLSQLCQDVTVCYPGLSKQESDYLPDYVKMIFAMEFLGATNARLNQDNQTSENSYWLERGRSGLINL